MAEFDESNARMGKAFLYVGWIIVLILATLVFGTWEEKQYNPNQTPESWTTSDSINEVVLQRNRMNHYVSGGTINDVPVTFLLDTGATLVSIPAALEHELGLKRGRAGYASTANGTVKVYSTTLDKLQLGTITLYNVRASINPGMEDNEILLGMSVLRDIEFTQSGNTLTLKQHPNR